MFHVKMHYKNTFRTLRR